MLIVNNYVKYYQNYQKRKFSRTPSNLGITANPTPAAPFEVWEIDLYISLPISKQGSSYIFTGVNIFSKYILAFPIKSKDAVTVSYAIVKHITPFGVCNTVINDQGSEFITKVTSKLWKMLYIAHQYTPGFMYHSLVACKRIHATLDDKFTPYIHRRSPCNSKNI